MQLGSVRSVVALDVALYRQVVGSTETQLRHEGSALVLHIVVHEERLLHPQPCDEALQAAEAGDRAMRQHEDKVRLLGELPGSGVLCVEAGDGHAIDLQLRLVLRGSDRGVRV